MAEDLRKGLAAMRASFVAFCGFGSGAFYPVKVRPSLGFSMVPRPKRRPDPAESQRTEDARKRERIAAALAPAQPGTAGLVEGSKLDAFLQNQPKRQGLQGLSAAGGLSVEDLCSLWRQDRGCYGFWTVTLPVEAATALDRIPDGAQKLSDTLRRRFGEALRRSCEREARAIRRPVPDHWLFVVEPQSSGRPHWHFVFRAKSRRGRGWLLGKGRLDRLIQSAVRTVTGSTVSVRAAGNIQAVKTSPGQYLSSYLKKTASAKAAETVLEHGWSLNLVPHRWWGCSRSALTQLREHVFELPSVAVGWLSRQWPLLAQVGALDARIWQPEAEGAPAIVVGRWHGLAGLERVVAHLFCLAERSYPLGRTYGYN